MQTQARWLSSDFDVYDINTSWNDVPGVYIFTRRNQDLQGRSLWHPLYIGQTGSFKDRLTILHEKWQPALQKGFSHIHVLVVNGETQRVRLEKSLIQAYHPELNDLHT